MSERLASDTLTVADLEQVLFEHFPRETAEDWDRCGLIVGDPGCQVGRVALALDATAAAVRESHSRGCNVLVTHHPVFLDPPTCFGPTSVRFSDAGSAVFEAARLGVALVNYHTCLDRALVAQQMMPRLLGLTYLHPLEGWACAGEAPSSETPAYGAVCDTGQPLALDELARLCDERLGGACRVWGDPGRTVRTVATCTGSVGDLAQEALQAGLDAVIAGEVRYHAGVDLVARGLSIIELGHDISELPLVRCLRDAIVAEGFDSARIELLELPGNWHAPKGE